MQTAQSVMFIVCRNHLQSLFVLSATDETRRLRSHVRHLWKAVVDVSRRRQHVE